MQAVAEDRVLAELPADTRVMLMRKAAVPDPGTAAALGGPAGDDFYGPGYDVGESKKTTPIVWNPRR